MKFIVLLTVLFTGSVFAQSDKAKAHDMGMEAITLMENGDTKGARKLLKKCQKLDPDNIDYPYEVAYSYMIDKNYSKVISICEKLKKEKGASDLIYQMLGNAYDYNKQPEKAIKTYDEGIERFPNSGPLHLERGHMENMAGKLNEALAYYEKGIEVAPNYPSCYYWATRVYLNSTQEVWGMVYGEIFMNLEPNTKRTADISKLLHDTYVSEISKKNDTTWSVSFNQVNVINVSDLSNLTDQLIGFGMSYEMCMSMAVPSVDEINANTIPKLRENFIEAWYSNENNKNFPNILFDFHKKMIDAGHFEAYSRWVILAGDEDAFVTWKDEHESEWNSFLAWYQDNALLSDKGHQFYRDQY